MALFAGGGIPDHYDDSGSGGKAWAWPAASQPRGC